MDHAKTRNTNIEFLRIMSIFSIMFLHMYTKRQKRRVHKGALDRPPGKQQKSGVELGVASTGQCKRGRSIG